MGKTWKEVSPDLTRNQKEKQGKGGGPYTNEAVGAENYGTLAYVAESPHEKGVIWTGSDDGLVQRDPRRRRHVEERDPARPRGVSGQCDRGVTVRQGHGVCRHDPIQVQRSRPRLVQDDRLRMRRGPRSTAGSRPMPSHESSAKTMSGAICCLRARSLACSSHGTAAGSGRHFSSTCRLRPITDLRVHQGNLIAATSGRSFWILDDLALIRQYQARPAGLLGVSTGPGLSRQQRQRSEQLRR